MKHPRLRYLLSLTPEKRDDFRRRSSAAADRLEAALEAFREAERKAAHSDGPPGRRWVQ